MPSGTNGNAIKSLPAISTKDDSPRLNANHQSQGSAAMMPIRSIATHVAIGLVITLSNPASATDVTDDDRTKRELLAENAKMRHEALTHWALAVRKKIVDNWDRPDDAVVDWTCTATIQMEPSGDVKTIAIDQCDGTSAFRDSIWLAIDAASPLPRPAISAVWQEKIRLNFKHE
ncbi:TonB C-terminal domain-containing protein [Guyparkeria hydrothermalis]|uniref:TonB C-terminal domain-containing protein n=1 Tax=Guyparkeria hydrothermalis TaxID=923 RepID=UPI0020205FA2|nr:TonB C-terminal domain-containing protein [Guyparkeria hydrothermalis]MCL7745187.1 TonB C-terminal domain-containing protein [Guyparkeria hydrothermalis]